jgi:hypothetical protein
MTCTQCKTDPAKRREWGCDAATPEPIAWIDPCPFCGGRDDACTHCEGTNRVGVHRCPNALVTQRESRKLSAGRSLKPYELYKSVSGVNAVRMRRLLSTLTGEDYASDSKPAYQQLRQATLVGQLTLPDVDLKRDIGGYEKVKDRLNKEILDVLALKDASDDEGTMKRIEGLIPRGMIFWGPPGTGKTLFAKAMATSYASASFTSNYLHYASRIFVEQFTIGCVYG